VQGKAQVSSSFITHISAEEEVEAPEGSCTAVSTVSCNLFILIWSDKAGLCKEVEFVSVLP
jgi:hypothetical protein